MAKRAHPPDEQPPAKRAKLPPPREAVTFDAPSHTYRLADGTKLTMSVSGLCACFFPPFDARAVSERVVASIARRGDGPEGSPSYAHLPLWDSAGRVVAEAPAVVRASWDATRDAGTAMHDRIEARCAAPLDAGGVDVGGLDADGPAPEEDKQFAAYAAWSVGAGRSVRAAEQRICSRALSLGGSVDLQWDVQGIDGRKKGVWPRVVVVDWKRISYDKLIAPAWGGERAYGPLARLLDASRLSKYTVQLWVYAALLERSYDVTVDSLEVVSLHPDNGVYGRIVVPFDRRAADEVLAVRAMQLREGLTDVQLRQELASGAWARRM